MKFRRAGSAALAAVMFASSVCIYADAAVDKEMEQALTYVKQRITVEEECSEFQHSTATQYGKKYYRFTWTTIDGLKGWNVTIKGNVITNIYRYDYGYNSVQTDVDDDDYDVEPGSFYVDNSNKPHFSKISEDELLRKAKEWMKKINPTINSQLETKDENFSIYLRGNNATLQFRRMNNGVPVSGQTGSITIDKNTGELVSYNLNWINGATFAPLENTISKAAAMDGYKNEFPAELIYTAEYDYENKEYVPHLIYRQVGSGEIDAFTGKKSTFEDYKSYDDYGYTEAGVVYDEDCDDDANPGTGGGVSFTDNEIKKLEEEQKLIKADESMQKLAEEGIFVIPKNWEINDDNCYYNYTENAYFRRVSFSAKNEMYIDADNNPIRPLEEGEERDPDCKVKVYSYSGNFIINAETGTVISFYCNDYSFNDDGLDIAKTTKTANEYMKKLLGKDAGKFVMDKEPDISKYYKNRDENGKGIGDPTITSIAYKAPRVANGITSDSEGVSFTIGQSGKIKQYNLTFHNIEYPKPDDIISPDLAYSRFFDNIDFSMTYHCAYRTKDKKIVSALVYRTSDRMYIDAFTGERTYYNGSKIEKAEIYPNSYNDLDKSTYAKYAKKLLLYGVCIADKDGSLSENDTIDAKTFIRLITSTIGYAGLPSDIKNEDLITNKIAARLIVRCRYGDAIPSMKGIFKSPFKDVKDTDPYVGYIAIANAEGIMKGSKGSFKPNSPLTRGRALKIVYDYLS